MVRSFKRSDKNELWFCDTISNAALKSSIVYVYSQTGFTPDDFIQPPLDITMTVILCETADLFNSVFMLLF